MAPIATTPALSLLLLLALTLSCYPSLIDGFSTVQTKYTAADFRTLQRKSKFVSMLIDSNKKDLPKTASFSPISPLLPSSSSSSSSSSSMNALTTRVDSLTAADLDSLTKGNNNNNLDNQYELSPQQFVYVVLTSIFVTCLIVADVVGVKLFDITLPFEIFGRKSIEHTCGMLTFPITFVLGDMINEYYGPKAAKNTVYIGLAMSILVFIVMNIAQAMPYLDKPFNVTPESFNMIFGSAKLMYVASVTAYLIGSLSDIWLFGLIKKATKGNLLWLRATGSTVISQILDSFVVSYVAFSLGKSLTGQTPATFSEIMNIATTGYGLKFFLAFSMTPFLYVLKGIMSERFGLQPVPSGSSSDDE